MARTATKNVLIGADSALSCLCFDSVHQSLRVQEPNGLKIAIFSFSTRSPKDKMVGSNGTMIAIRLVRSKLRKREEHSNSVHPADVVLHQTTPAATNLSAQPPTAPQALQPDPLAYRGQFLWQYPPPPPQPYMYNNDQVHIYRHHVFAGNFAAIRPSHASGNLDTLTESRYETRLKRLKVNIFHANFTSTSALRPNKSSRRRDKIEFVINSRPFVEFGWFV